MQRAQADHWGWDGGSGDPRGVARAGHVRVWMQRSATCGRVEVSMLSYSQCCNKKLTLCSAKIANLHHPHSVWSCESSLLHQNPVTLQQTTNHNQKGLRKHSQARTNSNRLSQPIVRQSCSPASPSHPHTTQSLSIPPSQTSCTRPLSAPSHFARAVTTQ
jgi:hypothetical protein